jgi:hypothetical protein
VFYHVTTYHKHTQTNQNASNQTLKHPLTKTIPFLILSRYKCDSLRGFGLNIGPIEHSNTNPQLHLITAPSPTSTFYKSLKVSPPARSAPTRRPPATALNNGHPSASGLKSPSNCLFLLQLSSYPLRTNRVENTVSNSTYIIASIYVAAGTYLPSRYLKTALVDLLISRPLHSNGSIRYNIMCTYSSRHRYNICTNTNIRLLLSPAPMFKLPMQLNKNIN